MSQMTSNSQPEAGGPHPHLDVLTAKGDPSPHGFGLSHPKNYLGVPLAVDAAGDTGGLVMQHLVGMAGEAKLGATALGLLTANGSLTERGTQIVAAARDIHGSSRDGLRSFHELKGSSGRFITSRPQWTTPLQSVLAAYPLTQAVLTDLSSLSVSRTLPELVGSLADSHPEITATYLLTVGDIDSSTPVGDAAEAHRNDADIATACPWTTTTDAFQTQTTFQFKSLLCHAGILTQPGADSSQLTPTTDTWALSPRLDDHLIDAVDTNGGDRR